MSSRNILRCTVSKYKHPFPAILQTSGSISNTSSSIVRTTSSLTDRLQYPHPVWRIQSSSLGSATFVILASSIFVTSLYFYHTLKPNLEGVHDKSDNAVEDIGEPEVSATMSGTGLPGRPGNLTVDQEAKLQELWTAVLSVFGVPLLNNSVNNDVASTVESEGPDQAEQGIHTDATGSEKRRKKRTIMFSRKQNEDPTRERASGVYSMDGNDKYGQAKDYRKLLESQSPEDLRKAFWSMVKHDDPDGLLLRFLRARKWNVKNALIMLVAAMHWRTQELHVDDDILRRGDGGSIEDSMSSNPATKKGGEDFLAQLRLGKSFLHGTDREGRPMCFVRVRLHKQGEQTESSLERYTVYTIETARYLLSSNVDTAVSHPLS